MLRPLLVVQPWVPTVYPGMGLSGNVAAPATFVSDLFECPDIGIVGREPAFDRGLAGRPPLAADTRPLAAWCLIEADRSLQSGDPRRQGACSSASTEDSTRQRATNESPAMKTEVLVDASLDRLIAPIDGGSDVLPPCR